MTVVVVAGVAGSGKTEVGRALARRMSVDFVDADSFHSAEAVQQMRANHPLTEREREAWLSRLVRAVRGRDPLVIACSALRRSHRDRLRTLGDVRLFMLDVPDNELRRRLDVRRGHFFSAGLLDDQLSTLERPAEDEPVVVLAGDIGIGAIVGEILGSLAAAG